MRSPRWPACFILSAECDHAPIGSATFIILLLVCLTRSPPVSSATVPWIQQQELTAADGARDDVFGYSVAVSGTTAVIGAAGRTIGNNPGQGAAYVFTCSGTPCTWSQQQELTASDGARDDEFGNSVAVSGNTAIIGAWGKNSLYLPGAPTTALAPQGAAYVFTCSGTPCTWTQQQELTAADGANGDEFGNTVAVSGNTAIIGA